MIAQPLTLIVLAQAADAPATAPATRAATQPAPDDIPGREMATQAMELLGPTFAETSLTGWLTLLAGIFAGLVAGKIVQSMLKNIAARLKARGWSVRAAVFQHAAGPANLALFALGLGVGLQALVLSETLQGFPPKIIGFLYIIALAWFLYNLVDLIDLGLRRLTAKSATRLDDTVLTLLRKALRIFLLIMFALFVAENFFGADITAWLAGLGIAGLAVSLAAQDSVKNLFGSMTVLIERPFGLGDRIVFGGYDGTVETIGFRSTKIRTISGHLVTVPNMRFTDGTIENISARPFQARTINLQVTYDTPPEKLEQAVDLVKRILAEPEIAEPISAPDRPPRVYFTDFGPAGLNLMVNYNYAITAPGRDWWTYQTHAQQINLKLLRAFNQAGIEIAFPTQRMLLAGDSKRHVLARVMPEEETGR